MNLISIWVDPNNLKSALIQTLNLIYSNFITKVNMTLLQTVEIADQNGGKNVGKTNSGNDELVFLAQAIKESTKSRRRRL